ncbi:MAG: YdeI/OmpD-associated family protein [Bacteroidota bacterium]
MKIKVPIMKFEYDMWSFYMEVDAQTATPFIQGKDRRITWEFADENPFHAALMPKKGVYSIYITSEFMKKNAIEPGDTIEIELEKDTSEFGIEMPESFSALLDQDQEGAMYFLELSKGQQRSLLHIVGKVKNVDSQISKGMAIMQHLKETCGTLDFKRLNELIKEFNQQRKSF